MNEGILIPVASFAMVFGIVYIAVTTRHRERMMLIEKGESAEIFNKSKDNKSGLKNGIIAIGVGLGFVVANMLVTANVLTKDIAVPAMILIFGGASSVLGYIIANKPKEQN